MRQPRRPRRAGLSSRHFVRLSGIRDRQHGFTMIELLVVVVIIGILIAIAIPLYLNYQKGSKDKAAQSDLRNAIGVLEACKADNSAYPSALGTTSTNVYSEMDGCSGQKINKSPGTVFSYSSSSPYSSFILTSYNTGGTPKYYCYNSTSGGSISTVSSASSTC